MDIVIKVLQFVASFSLLILVHEMGHFLFARLFGIRVEKFYLFFNPGFSLVKFKYKGTEYGIGWLPFGGYCKIAGMVDESMDTESLQSEPKPDEFRSKPAWQRLLVMVGGVMMNIVLAICIYIGMTYTWGTAYRLNSEVENGSMFNELAQEIGFRNGDHILSVDGQQVEIYDDIYRTMLLDMAPEVEVLRDGQRVTVKIDDKFRPRMNKAKDFMTPRQEFVIGLVGKDSPAKAAGLQVGDRVAVLEGDTLRFFDEYVPLLAAHAGKTVRMTLQRDSAGVATFVTLHVAVNDKGKIGVGVQDDLPVHTKYYTFWQAIPAGIVRTGEQIAGYWKQLGMIFSPKTEGYKSVGGLLSIGNLFPTVWDWFYFWSITAFISIALAVLNILPLPVLDGGHVVFLLYEVVTRRKPSEKFLERAMTVGLLILVTVILLANGNDIYQFFIKGS